MPKLSAVKAVPPILAYTALRLVLFVLPLIALLLLHVMWLIAVIAAALIGLCLSYIMLAGPRHAVAQNIYERRHRERTPPNEDDDAEDAVVDRWKPSDTD